MTRLALATIGVAVAAYGLYLLLDQGFDNLLATAYWLGGGVVAHDFVFAPLVIAACFVVARLLPAVARGPVAAGALVLVTVTVTAVPVLGRFGARPDNATLLDRNYGAGWLLLAGLTLAAVLVTVALRARRMTTRRGRGPDSRR